MFRIISLVISLVLCSFFTLGLVFGMTQLSYGATQTSSVDLGDLKYNHFRPQWGVGLNSSPVGMGDKNFSLPTNENLALNSFYLNLDYQPSFFQSYGVFSVGMLGSVQTPKLVNDSSKPGLIYLWSVGGDVRYQARYFDHQFIVPMVSYSVESLNYKLRTNSKGRLISRGPTFGVWILLNYFDPGNGKDFFYDYGIARSYLTFEIKNSSGTNLDGASTSEQSYYCGIRFEF